jgi:hypothetical protein
MQELADKSNNSKFALQTLLLKVQFLNSDAHYQDALAVGKSGLALAERLGNRGSHARILADGQHSNPTQIAHYFTSAFFHHPHELREEVEAAGLQLEKMLTIEGIAVFVQDLGERWADTRRREQLLEAVRWLEDDPAVLGITGHLMAVARA